MDLSLVKEVRDYVNESVEAMAGILGCALVFIADLILGIFGYEVPQKLVTLLVLVFMSWGGFLSWRKQKQRVNDELARLGTDDDIARENGKDRLLSSKFFLAVSRERLALLLARGREVHISGKPGSLARLDRLSEAILTDARLLHASSEQYREIYAEVQSWFDPQPELSRDQLPD